MSKNPGVYTALKSAVHMFSDLNDRSDFLGIILKTELKSKRSLWLPCDP